MYVDCSCFPYVCTYCPDGVKLSTHSKKFSDMKLLAFVGMKFCFDLDHTKTEKYLKIGSTILQTLRKKNRFHL